MRSLVLRWSVALLLGSAWGWVMSPPGASASNATHAFIALQR
jgi:hypothetical protein